MGDWVNSNPNINEWNLWAWWIIYTKVTLDLKASTMMLHHKYTSVAQQCYFTQKNIVYLNIPLYLFYCSFNHVLDFGWNSTSSEHRSNQVSICTKWGCTGNMAWSCIRSSSNGRNEYPDRSNLQWSGIIFSVDRSKTLPSTSMHYKWTAKNRCSDYQSQSLWPPR